MSEATYYVLYEWALKGVCRAYYGKHRIRFALWQLPEWVVTRVLHKFVRWEER